MNATDNLERLNRLWTQANDAFRLGNLAECHAKLLPIIADCGPQPETIMLAAQSLLGLGDAFGALDRCLTGLDEQPRSARLWATASVAWLNCGNVAASKQCLELARHLDPLMPDLEAYARQLMGTATGQGELPETWQSLVTRADRRPTLGACLIVRNEARMLPACLESLAGFDEIVVVDTGSTDETVAIARRFGAKIGYFAWCDDFAAARNAALALATADWILTIDADERLVGGDHRSVRQSIDQFGGLRTVLCPMIDSTDPSVGQGTSHSGSRLFARQPGRRYAGRIHEELREPAGHVLTNWPAGPWRLMHVGYEYSVRQQKQKAHRNLPLLQRWCEEEPGNARAFLYLAGELRSLSRNHEAIEALQRVLSLPASTSDQGLATLQLMGALFALGRYEETIQLAKSAESLCQHSPDYWMCLGRSLAILDRSFEAEAAFKRAMAVPIGGLASMESFGARTWRPRLGLAELAMEMGDLRKAYDSVRALLPEAGLAIGVQTLYVRAALALGFEDEVRTHCESLLKRSDVSPKVVVALAKILASSGSAGQRVLAAFSQWAGGFPAIADQLIEQEDWEQLLAFAQRWSGEQGARAAQEAGLALARLGRHEEARAALEQATALDPTLATPWHNLGAMAFSRGELDAAEQLLGEALKRDPASMITMVNLAKVARQRGNIDEAAAWLKQAQAIAPDHTGIADMLEDLRVAGTY